MTDFTLRGFAAKLAELAAAVREAEHTALRQAAVLVECTARVEASTDDLRNNIGHIVADNEAHIGSNSKSAVAQELGTAHLPPRSILAGALVHETDAVVKIIRDGIVGALKGHGA